MGLVKEFIISIRINMEQNSPHSRKPSYLPAPPMQRPQEEEPPLLTHPLTSLYPKENRKIFFSFAEYAVEGLALTLHSSQRTRMSQKASET